MDVSGYATDIDRILLNTKHNTGTYFLKVVYKRIGPKKTEKWVEEWMSFTGIQRDKFENPHVFHDICDDMFHEINNSSENIQDLRHCGLHKKWRERFIVRNNHWLIYVMRLVHRQI